jgi:hypothetical protein
VTLTKRLSPIEKKYRSVTAPAMAQQYGWPGRDDAEREWDRIGADFPEFPNISGAAGDRLAKITTFRAWEKLRKVTGHDPDNTPQPTGNCVAAAAERVLEMTQAVQIDDAMGSGRGEVPEGG